MRRDDTMGRYITNFEAKHVNLWGLHTIKLDHQLHELRLFDDVSLAELIDSVPTKIIHHSVPGMEQNNSAFSHCDCSGLAGKKVLDAVKNGRIWVNLMALQKVDQRFADILDAIYEEVGSHIPTFKLLNRSIGLLISSPKTIVHYHSDIPGQCLWQIRGEKRVWIYPNKEPFLKAEDLENLAREVKEELMPYEPWFDEFAQVYDLEPGEMLHWPLNGPHKVENADSLNISLTTEHWTPEIRRSKAMNYGNGLLRSHFGWTPRSSNLRGPAFWAKAGLSVAWRKSGLQQREHFQRTFEYYVDPESIDGVRPVSRPDQGG